MAPPLALVVLLLALLGASAPRAPRAAHAPARGGGGRAPAPPGARRGGVARRSGSRAPPCRLLSFSGGGSWGAFEAGVLSRLVERRTAATPDWDVDALLGVSAGALNAALLATHARGTAGLRAGAAELRMLWSKARTADVWSLPGAADALGAGRGAGGWSLGLPRGLLSTRPLDRLLARTLGGRALARNVSIGLTNLASGQAVVADERTLRGRAPAGSRSVLHTHLMASCAIPFLFPPVSVNKSLHIDGGVSHNVLTHHGLSRYCPDRSAPVELEIIDAMPRARALTAEESQKLGALDIALRTAQLLFAAAAEHELNARCADGVTSNIVARVHSPSNAPRDTAKAARFAALMAPMQGKAVSMLDFDHGELMWRLGYEGSDVEEFHFCPH